MNSSPPAPTLFEQRPDLADLPALGAALYTSCLETA